MRELGLLIYRFSTIKNGESLCAVKIIHGIMAHFTLQLVFPAFQ